MIRIHIELEFLRRRRVLIDDKGALHIDLDASWVYDSAIDFRSIGSCAQRSIMVCDCDAEVGGVFGIMERRRNRGLRVFQRHGWRGDSERDCWPECQDNAKVQEDIYEG